MANLKLSNFTNVSNNSPLTNKVHGIIDEKLSDSEKVEFIKWLRLVDQETQSKVKAAVKRGRP